MRRVCQSASTLPQQKRLFGLPHGDTLILQSNDADCHHLLPVPGPALVVILETDFSAVDHFSPHPSTCRHSNCLCNRKVDDPTKPQYPVSSSHPMNILITDESFKARQWGRWAVLYCHHAGTTSNHLPSTSQSEVQGT